MCRWGRGQCKIVQKVGALSPPHPGPPPPGDSIDWCIMLKCAVSLAGPRRGVPANASWNESILRSPRVRIQEINYYHFTNHRCIHLYDWTVGTWRKGNWGSACDWPSRTRRARGQESFYHRRYLLLLINRFLSEYLDTCTCLWNHMCIYWVNIMYG